MTLKALMKTKQQKKNIRRKQRDRKALRDGVQWASTGFSRHPEKRFLVPRVFMGVNIYPAGENSSGMRWIANAGSGWLRADTLEGIKKLIREALK